LNEELNKEWDVIVVGFGAAGSAAAITAADSGARVLILEKAEEHRHTSNTRMSGGLIMTVNDPEKATEYLGHCMGNMIPTDLVERLAEYASRLHPWLNKTLPDLGLVRVNGAEHSFPGHASIDAFQPGNPSSRLDPNVRSGEILSTQLKSAVKSRPISVSYASPAKRLIQNDDGRVVGVVAQVNSVEQEIFATRGVILSTGGFEYDEEAKKSYLRSYPVYFYGNPMNTGDGIRMAQALGADLWHMNQMVGRAVNYHTTADGQGFGFFTNIAPAGYVMVDRFGKRFFNEDAQANGMHSVYYDLLKFDPEKGLYPRNPCYWIFDDARRQAGPLVLRSVGAVSVGLYDWSEDNSAELEAGWIPSGQSIAEAAAAAGVDDPEEAERAVLNYNNACDAGDPDPFGRAPESMVPIAKPPFYCVKLHAGGPNTTGGPRRDIFGRILTALGQPIHGLYGAGEMGQVSGLVYPADGFNLCEALCSGQMAAESVLSNQV
jgi:hypothetical protein